MSRSFPNKRTSKQSAPFQFELLEPRHLFSVTPFTPSSPEAPPVELTSAAPLFEAGADQSLTNFTWFPLVFAGPDQTVLVSHSLLLTGEVIVNADVNLSLTWSKVTGPGNAIFGSATEVSSSVTFDQAGTYELQLAATNNGLVGSARMTVFVTGPTPLPEYDRWVQDMIKYGRQHGEWLLAHQNDTAIDPPLSATYYDAARVFYQIADYTGDATWNAYAEVAVKVYRDRYVLPNNGGTPGYWKFTRGLVEHYERTGDIASKNAVLLIAKNASYNPDTTPLEWTAHASKSREVAYAIMNYLDAERLGAPRRERLHDMFEQALGHLNQWFVQESDPQYSPFMFGLTADALMQYYEQVEQDPRILQMLELGANWTWDNAWVENNQAFWYGEGARTTGAPDLNLLIAPVYEWLYQKTGDTQYRNQGDQIFAGGVKGAWLSGAKQFNQNYRVSFDFVRMRLSPAAPQAMGALSTISEPSLLDLGFAVIGNSSVLTDSHQRLPNREELTELPSNKSDGLPARVSATAYHASHCDSLGRATALVETDIEWSGLADFLLRHHSVFGHGLD